MNKTHSFLLFTVQQFHIYIYIYIYIYVVPSISFQAFEIVIDSWKFTMLSLYKSIFMISASKEQLQQESEYTLLKPDCHSWWISKMQSEPEDTLEERYAIKFSLNSCRNRVSVFELHKRFKKVRESERDDERCGRSKEVNTPGLLSQRVRVNMFRF